MLTEILTRPVKAAVALVELPLTAKRSLDEVNQLMEVSRRQLEAMQRQTDSALDQAERMNELLARVVKLTEPIEKAQRGGEYFADGLRRMIFGDEPVGVEAAGAGAVEGAARSVERAAAEVEIELAGAEERAAIESEETAAIESEETPAIESEETPASESEETAAVEAEASSETAAAGDPGDPSPSGPEDAADR